MRFRYLGSGIAWVGGVIETGDVIDAAHPIFADDGRLFHVLLDHGDLVPLHQPETTMAAPAENMMRPLPRARKGRRHDVIQ